MTFSFRDFHVWSKALSLKNRSLRSVIAQYAQSSGLPVAGCGNDNEFAIDPEGKRKNANILI
jgi:hypothetical protein